MNRAIRENGRLYCPQCGKELLWESTEDRGGVTDDGQLEDDYTTIDCFFCTNCGASIEVWQALEGDKHNYPYWQDGNEQ